MMAQYDLLEEFRFPIGDSERDQWLLCMKQTLEEQINDERLRSQLMSAFAQTANHMRNQGGGLGGSLETLLP